MAFGESWLISVMMRFTSNGARVMNELATGAQAAEAKVDRVTAAMTRLRNASTMVAGGMALIGAAIEVYGISQAAKLELAMTGVYSATGANARQKTQLFNMVTAISGITAQSATTIANEAYMAASSGLNNPDRLRTAFPQIAKAADVLWLSTMGTPKAVDPTNAAMQMVKLSHLFGAYSGKPLADMVDFTTRLMMVQPDALSKVITQAKYFVPTAIGAGVDLHNIPSSDLAIALASMGQTGLLQGRGGTGLARFIEYMMKAPTLTAHLSKNQRASMIDLGLFDGSGRNQFLDAHGNFELGKSMHYLGTVFDRWAKAGERGRFIQDVFGAFLEQGGRYVETMTLPAVRAQQAQNRIAMQRIAPSGRAVETLWEKYMHTTTGAWKYFVTNFQNIWICTFTPILPQVTAMLRGLGDALGSVGGVSEGQSGLCVGHRLRTHMGDRVVRVTLRRRHAREIRRHRWFAPKPRGFVRARSCTSGSRRSGARRRRHKALHARAPVGRHQRAGYSGGKRCQRARYECCHTERRASRGTWSYGTRWRHHRRHVCGGLLGRHSHGNAGGGKGSASCQTRRMVNVGSQSRRSNARRRWRRRRRRIRSADRSHSNR